MRGWAPHRILGATMTTTVQEHVDAPAPPPRRPHRRRQWVAAILAVALVAAGATWVLLVQQRSSAIAAANFLDPQGSTSGIFFADPRDEAAVRVTADDFEEYSRTVPLRKGESMPLVMLVTDDSDYPATVQGSTDPDRLVITTAVEAEDANGGTGDWRERTFAKDVVIAPGRRHYLRSEYTTAQTCLVMGKGTGLTLGDFSVNTLVDGTPRVVQVRTAPIIRVVSTTDDEPADCAAAR